MTPLPVSTPFHHSGGQHAITPHAPGSAITHLWGLHRGFSIIWWETLCLNQQVLILAVLMTRKCKDWQEPGCLIGHGCIQKEYPPDENNMACGCRFYHFA